ncbi:ABC transporter permease [Alkalihalophilus lindianensis]|uniref:Nickel import system permease protein NikB n=1 Tax=Alkalihalophilus lindianensis TaxID=1630542 RepID=A0ABU3XDN5_9BACI|nr:nickel ABC transporter permease [Alkalihalophilus lindianensis]MDV2685992.1 ABC transporter permease [Alkalihalophilus lindianensis]
MGTLTRTLLKVAFNRLLQLVIMILVLSFITFLLMKVTPGDPIRTILKVDEMVTSTTDEAVLLEEFGFDQPIYIQYGQWLWNVMQFDLGESLITKKSVSQMIFSRLPATLALAFGGLVVLLLISIPLGMLGAIYENKWPDYMSRILAFIGSSIPSFWLGLLLIYFFSLKLNVLPVSGKGTLAHYILPSITLGIAMAPMYIRLLRERLIGIQTSSYIEAAMARGISRSRIFWFHTFRGSLIPILTLFGLSIGSLLGGITVVEIIFSWPGMGQLIVDAIMQRDYPVIQGYILVVGLLVVVTNMMVDFIYTVVNPQMKQ